MENQIQILDKQQPVNTGLSEKESKIAMVVCDVSQLMSYPLSDQQVEDWSKTLNRLFPDLQITRLRAVVDEYLLGKDYWDSKEGIQNITRNISTKPKFVY